MSERLVVGPADHIDGVIERMHSIDAVLPNDDGVAEFNRMYLRVTEEVGKSVQGKSFEDREFLERLDIVFANHFFAAFDADALRGDVPRPWSPLFDARHKPHTHPIQFAFAGMNAHINHDLGIAVVGTCDQLAIEPVDGSPEHRDFCATNEILDELMPTIKAWFADGVVGRIDRDAGWLDDAFERWAIAVIREAAWDVGQLIWSLRDHPHMQKLFLGTLARSVCLAGHGLLI
jgi:hypothetical protein